MKERTALQLAIYDMRWGGIPAQMSQFLAGLRGFRMPEPNESRSWLTEAWERGAPNAIPVSWSVRGLPDERWVRFHSLPESKRYIEDPFVSGDFYPGDLLLAVIGAPDDAWDRLSDMTLASLATVIGGLPGEVLANLPKGDAELLARFTAEHG